MASRQQWRAEVKPAELETTDAVVQDELEALVRQGARQMLMLALNEEVDSYLGRGRYQRTDEFRGYRNGATPRGLTVGSGTIPLAVPRVRDVPEGQQPFESKILGRYQRRSDTVDQTFLNLFVEGLGTEKACLMVLIGADKAGNKHLIALREGYRESTESWGDLIRDCRRRGLNEPACWIADGALGLWAAIDEQSPHSAQQRCTNHKTMNVVDKLPRNEQPEAIKRLRAIWQAEDERAARKLAAGLIHDFRTAGYDRAGDCLASDLDRCLTFFKFPQAHWSHLRTSNPIESVFASVRLRTNAAKRFKKTRSGVCLVYQVMQRLSRHWRRLKSAHLCPTVPLPEVSKKKAKKSA
jgi:transposase-like protein